MIYADHDNLGKPIYSALVFAFFFRVLLSRSSFAFFFRILLSRSSFAKTRRLVFIRESVANSIIAHHDTNVALSLLNVLAGQ